MLICITKQPSDPYPFDGIKTYMFEFEPWVVYSDYIIWDTFDLIDISNWVFK